MEKKECLFVNRKRFDNYSKKQNVLYVFFFFVFFAIKLLINELRKERNKNKINKNR